MSVPVAEKNPYLGIGLYTVPEAARILEVEGRKLTRWADGYTFATDNGTRTSGPVFERTLPELAEKRILTFAELIELYLVNLFRTAGVSMSTIREAQERLRKRYGVSHPFAARRVQTDGTRLFEEMAADDGGRRHEEILKAQFVISEAAEPFFRKLDYDEDFVRRYWPLGRDRPVCIDPSRSFGKPVEALSGVPTYVLYGMRLSGESVEAIADWYEVEPEGVRAAIEYETQLAA